MSESFVSKARKAVWKYVGAAFLEPKDGSMALSLGRASFAVLFSIACWKWTHDIDPPVTMVSTLGLLLGYIGVGRVADVIRGKGGET